MASKPPNNLLGATFVAFVLCMGGFSLHGQTASERQSKYALLIGCGHYPTLSKELQLEGPVNDVKLMRHMLEETFGFTSANIVTLATDQPDVSHQPTRANIQSALASLVEKAVSDDQVFIFFAGHGSQQPQQGKDLAESDGLDEIFLPSDVGTWNGELGGVENAIVDDEIGLWLRPLEAKGAYITLIVDACHSGSLMRSKGAKSRDVPMEQLVPRDVIQNLAKRHDQTSTKPETPPKPKSTKESALKPGRTVAIYASLPNEQTIEDSFQTAGAPGQVHGLLTYTLCNLLNHAEEPLSYQELITRVHQSYADRAISSPVPNLGGNSENRIVFGIESWGDDWIRLQRSGNVLTLNRGRLSGVDVDCILQIYRSPTVRGDSLGYIRVQAAELHQSQAIPVDYNNRLVGIEEIGEQAYCRVVSEQSSFGKLSLALKSDANDDTASSDLIIQLRKRLEDPSRPAGMGYELTDPAKADWILDMKSQQISVVSSGRSPDQQYQGHRLDVAPLRFGPQPIGTDTQAWIDETLKRISRVDSLLRIAEQESQRRKRRQCPRVEISLQSDSGNQDKTEEPQLFRNGERMSLQIVNPCPTSVDVTAWVIDNNLTINVLYPDAERGETNRLVSGQKLELKDLPVEADRLAYEHLIVITVMGEGPITNLSTIFRNEAKREGKAPIFNLIEQAMREGSGVRSGNNPSSTKLSIQKVTWQVSR